MDQKPRTPFPVTGYFGPDYYCDRQKQLKQLITNIRGGHSTTLTSLRRLGKTALIHHLFHHLGSRYNTIYLDILATESLADFLNRLTTALATKYSERTHIGKKLWKMIQSLRPVISYDPLSGTPLISIRSSPDESRKTMGELLHILDAQPKPVVIAIDEFQQILEYPEKRTDAWLRTLVQQLKNITFVFSGSQQHLMRDLFSNPERPFFRSTQFIKLGQLGADDYRDFILAHFRKHSRSISEETVSEMLDWAYHHTYYVQLLCNRVYLSATRKISTEIWKEEAGRILKEQEFVFIGYREMLTKAQWELLKAIAADVQVYQPTSSAFISRYSLGNPATVLRSLKALQRMDLVFREYDENSNTFFGIYDVWFSRWLQTS